MKHKKTIIYILIILLTTILIACKSNKELEKSWQKIDYKKLAKEAKIRTDKRLNH